MPQRSFRSLAAAALIAAGIPSALAAERGALDITYKQGDAQATSDAGRVRLYSASKALVIGIDRYAQGWPRLSMAVKDAEEVAGALNRLGFDVKLQKDLRSDDLDRTLRDFFINEGADPEARLLVWFAGHGHTVQGEGYLVPADAPDPSLDVQFRRKALSLRRFGEYMREARAKHVLAIFDSCFAGTVFNVARSAPPRAITLATTLPVRQFISSGDADQTVSDDGTFRRLFIDALEGREPAADANFDGYITGTELGLFLFDKMTNLSSDGQTPRYGKLNALGYDRGDFVLELKNLETVAAAPPPPSALPRPPADQQSRAAATAIPPRKPSLRKLTVAADGRELMSVCGGVQFTVSGGGPSQTYVLQRLGVLPSQGQLPVKLNEKVQITSTCALRLERVTVAGGTMILPTIDFSEETSGP